MAGVKTFTLDTSRPMSSASVYTLAGVAYDPAHRAAPAVFTQRGRNPDRKVRVIVVFGPGPIDQADAARLVSLLRSLTQANGRRVAD